MESDSLGGVWEVVVYPSVDSTVGTSVDPIASLNGVLITVLHGGALPNPHAEALGRRGG